jgi:opacity protein-like surface antigen
VKKTLSVLALGLLLGLTVYAQDAARADLFLGYSFLRYNSAQTIPAFTANGGIGTFGWNFNPHIGLEAELGGYHNGNINSHQFDSTSFSYLFGPRLSYHRGKTVDPYIHTLFGGQNYHTSICCYATGVTPVVYDPNGSRVAVSQNNFAMAIGGGLDIKIAKNILLRPVQLDYYLTRFQAPNVNDPTGTPSTNRNQNNLRYAAGIAFTFGAQ